MDEAADTNQSTQLNTVPTRKFHSITVIGSVYATFWLIDINVPTTINFISFIVHLLLLIHIKSSNRLLSNATIVRRFIQPNQFTRDTERGIFAIGKKSKWKKAKEWRRVKWIKQRKNTSVTYANTAAIVNRTS